MTAFERYIKLLCVCITANMSLSYCKDWRHKLIQFSRLLLFYKNILYVIDNFSVKYTFKSHWTNAWRS